MNIFRPAITNLSVIAILFSSGLVAQQTMAMHNHESMSDSACISEWAKPIELFSAEKIGTLSHPVSTKSEKAQLYFNQGLTFYYGFDSLSAMRSFHAASEADNKLAMAYWGVALAAGGDLNIPINDPCMKLAIQQSKLALLYKEAASEADKLYVNAIAVRYGTDISAAPADRDPAQLSVPFMLAMRGAYEKLFLQSPTPDPDVAALYAVALMNLRPWLWWTTDGKPSNEITLALSALETGLRNPKLKDHLGLNHFYIHAAEEAPMEVALHALPSAQRLMELAPERTSHLRHMPAHTFLRAGMWPQVVAANERAVAADKWWADQCTASIVAPQCNQLLVGHYSSHDMLFLAVGLNNQGLWDKTQNIAEQTEANATRFLKTQPDLEHYLTTRAMMAAHFGKWEYLAALPKPQSPMPDPHASAYCSQLHYKLETAIWYFGQTMADAQFKRSTRENLYAFNQASACSANANQGWGNNAAASILAVVHWRLLARIAQKEGRTADSVEDARLAVEMEDLLDYDEPPGWYIYSRETLGAALLRANKADEALEVFEQDLAAHPNDSRSLFGRWQALLAKHSPDAQKAGTEFKAQWLGSDYPSLDDM